MGRCKTHTCAAARWCAEYKHFQALADSMMDECGAKVYVDFMPGAPAGSKSAGGERLVSTMRAQAAPASGCGGSGTVIA